MAERSISSVLTDALGNLEEIARAEVRLAKVELRNEATQAARAGSLLSSGMGLGVYAVGLLLALMVALLARIAPLWLAIGIVFSVATVSAAALLLAGRRNWKRLQLLPRTAKSVEQGAQWLKAQTK